MRLQLSKSFVKEFESLMFSDHELEFNGGAGDQKLQRCWPTTEYILLSVYSKITNCIKHFHIFFHFLKI